MVAILMEAGGSSHIKDGQGRTPLHQLIRQMASDEAQAAKVASVKVEAPGSKQAEKAASGAPEEEGPTKEGEKTADKTGKPEGKPEGKPKEKDLGIRGKVVEVVAETVASPSPLWNIVAMLVGAGKPPKDKDEDLKAGEESIDDLDNMGRTPFTQAVTSGLVSVAALLGACRADHRTKDASGLTPLHHAVQSGNLGRLLYTLNHTLL